MVAGCTEPPGISGPTPYDLSVHNETEGERRVCLTVSDVEEDAAEIADTRTVAPGAERRYNNASRSGPDVEVAVDVADGCSATTVWRDARRSTFAFERPG